MRNRLAQSPGLGGGGRQNLRDSLERRNHRDVTGQLQPALIPPNDFSSPQALGRQAQPPGALPGPPAYSALPSHQLTGPNPAPIPPPLSPESLPQLSLWEGQTRP